MHHKSLFLSFILCFVAAIQIAAQQGDVSGRYEGTADIQPFGKLKLTAEIRGADDKLSGVLHTPLGDVGIIEGSFSEDKLKLKADAGGDDLILAGTRSASGKFSGTISSEAYKGTFELNRVGDVEPEKDTSIAWRQSKEKWHEDLRFLSEELPKRHKNAFHQISREQFGKMIADLDARIEALSDDEIIWGMIHIVTGIGDGHTGLNAVWSYPRIPVGVFWFGNELRVIRVSKDYPRLNGARLVKINGVPIEKIFEQSREYIAQGESEQFVRNASQSLMIMLAFLKVIGIAKDTEKIVYEFVDTNGKKFSQSLQTVPPDQKVEWIYPYKKAPLYLQNEDQPLAFSYLEESHTVYVNFKWYPRRPEFVKFSKELFDFVDKNPVEKLVIDMRQNGGGDFTRGRDFLVKQIKERQKFLTPGHLFVIAGRQTFSAGMTNTADFKNDLHAILVGEPTGARPNGYQENRTILLPNSHLGLSYSVELYKFSQQDTPGIIPDKRIEPDWKSFQAGTDPVLEWILKFRSQ